MCFFICLFSYLYPGRVNFFFPIEVVLLLQTWFFLSLLLISVLIWLTVSSKQIHNASSLFVNVGKKMWQIPEELNVTVCLSKTVCFLKFSLCVTLLWKTVSAHFRISLFSPSNFYAFDACKTAVIYIHGHKESAIVCTYDIVLPRMIGFLKILNCEEHCRMVSVVFQKIVICAIDSSQNTSCLLPMKWSKASWFFYIFYPQA